MSAKQRLIEFMRNPDKATIPFERYEELYCPKCGKPYNQETFVKEWRDDSACLTIHDHFCNNRTEDCHTYREIHIPDDPEQAPTRHSVIWI